MAKANQSFSKDEHANTLGNSFLFIALLIVGAVVGMKVLGALLPSYFSGLGDVVTTFDTATTGNADADEILPTFGLVAAFAGIAAVVGLVFVVVKLRRSG